MTIYCIYFKLLQCEGQVSETEAAADCDFLVLDLTGCTDSKYRLVASVCRMCQVCSCAVRSKHGLPL